MVQNMTLARKPFGCGIMNQICLRDLLDFVLLGYGDSFKTCSRLSMCKMREKYCLFTIFEGKPC